MAVDTYTYGTVDGVQALVGDAAADRTFATFTVPSDTEVEGFLDDIASELHAALAEAGYPVELAATLLASYPRVYRVLHYANNVGTAAYLVDSFSGEAIASPDDLQTVATRTQRLYRRYNRLLKNIKGNALERLGLVRSTKVGAGMATSVTSDPRFFRGWTSQKEAD